MESYARESENRSEAPAIRASIHVGASAVSMLILDCADSENPVPLEFLEQPLPLARDIFSKGLVTRSTAERVVEILAGYMVSLRELGAGLAEVSRVVASNILSEATNRELIANRLAVATGLPIEILDDGEMTRLVYLKTLRRLHEIESMRKRVTLVVHVGPGNTRALLFSKGHIEEYESYRMGTHRTAEIIEASFAEGESQLRLIRDNASGPISRILFDLRDQEVQELVLIGYEIQLLAPYLLKSSNSTRCSVKALRTLTLEAARLPEDQRAAAYQLDYHTADALLPALQINLAIAEAFGVKQVHIPTSDYERGLLHDLPFSAGLTREFETEVIRSAKNLAEKYETHSNHGEQVAFLCKRLFEETQELHNLSDQDALLLHVAAIVHEVGGFVSPHAHHKHSEYIILNSEIFGLSARERTLVALVARYHRMSPPKLTHDLYRSLPHPERIRVSKLASLLRVADALERTHSNRVRDLTVRVIKDKLLLELKDIPDATTERLALESKADLFRDIFGLEVIIAE
ncbi:HD domain-containing protein [Roseibacillus persicicus]|uniref:Exopolyphosphatase n=1 Tax=Roseibacillus persicicus TaxID=454148 RepID=A0A918WQQ0_9BACT|nr:HD domain-containing protein [Roseibacillus persicicus]MDQ8192265.1 HD domain-containing protein [Roseibacillus persicicus]GHC67372.1 exopolyphosphatase [Roseibacillus persicicus]